MTLDELLALPYVPFANYMKLDGVSATAIKALANEGPQVCYQVLYGDPEPPTAAMLLGTLVHAALEPKDHVTSRYLIAPPEYKTADSDKFASWCAELPAGCVGMTQRQAAASIAIAASVRPIIQRLASTSKVLSEVTIQWVDEATGLACKCRPDLLLVNKYTQRVTYVDIKTTQCVGERSLRSSCFRYGYHLQQAHYEAGLRSVLGPNIEVDTAFLFVRNKGEPYAARAIKFPDLDALVASRERGELMRQIADHTAANSWFDFAGVEELPLGLWAGDQVDVEEVEAT